jgi:hypothetical protein
MWIRGGEERRGEERRGDERRGEKQDYKRTHTHTHTNMYVPRLSSVRRSKTHCRPVLDRHNR